MSKILIKNIFCKLPSLGAFFITQHLIQNKDILSSYSEEEFIKMGEEDTMPKSNDEQGFNLQDFVHNMNQYIGATVTVFTTSEGIESVDITGVLLECTNSHIRILTNVGCPPPSINNTCNNFYCPFYKICPKRHQHSHQQSTLGSIAEIPVGNIAAFFHSAI